MNAVSPIIQASGLLKLIGTDNLVLVDAGGVKAARDQYNAKHLQGALYVDLDTQLADIKDDAAYGGRHPLPAPEKFSNVLASLGITPQSHVVVYDDKKGSNAASRFWWMLRAAGHEKVQVLNGGLQEAERAGVPVSSGQEFPKPASPYPVAGWLLPLSDIKEVEQVAQDERYAVVDVRDKERYNGEKEPIDLIAGHIPGAVNIPFTSNLDERGLFLPPEELKRKYETALKNLDSAHVIIHCGSGVTACHTVLAMAYAGLEIPKLYVGSWSEWSRNDKPMITQQSK